MVLELTLKHVKALTNLIDQQQQKILALQSGLQAGERLCLARIWGGWGGSSADRAAGPAPARRNTCTVSLGQWPVSASQRSGFSSGAMGTGSWAPWLWSFWVLGVCLPASYGTKAPRVCLLSSWVSASWRLGVWHAPGRVTAGVFPAFHWFPEQPLGISASCAT